MVRLIYIIIITKSSIQKIIIRIYKIESYYLLLLVMRIYSCPYIYIDGRICGKGCKVVLFIGKCKSRTHCGECGWKISQKNELLEKKNATRQSIS